VAVQLSPDQVAEFVEQFRAGLRDAGVSCARPVSALVDPLKRGLQIVAELNARYEAKRTAWERDRPMREKAEAAYRAANARRAAELGCRAPDGRPLVLAALWADEPVRTQVW
jgi:hypothetical protein